MKKIDRLVMGSFVGPFTASFGIALFVLIMQFLWLYIDDIAGKGVGLFLIIELIGYLSISIFPMALPVAVMLASVMVMGNLAERYELSSMKSAGVSLLRIMASLIVICAGISVFSYICSDFLIPVSNLKFKTRLFDIKRQKPALSLEEGVFNEDFRQFVIRIKDKEADGETLDEVMVIDQSSQNQYRLNEILADSGQMYTTTDGRFFVMNLFEGTQYQEPVHRANNPEQRFSYPFVRIKFGSMTKVWDMREFELNRTDEDNFKTNRQMLSMSQLRAASDSLEELIATHHTSVAKDVLVRLEKEVKPLEPQQLDSLSQLKMQMAFRKKDNPEQPVQHSQVLFHQDSVLPELTTLTSFAEAFRGEDREKLLSEAQKRVKSNISILETRKNQIDRRMLDRVKITYDLYVKYTFAVICLLFLFIGGPMGAIIRKGGFGYPILVSIIFFVVFVMLTIMCRKLAEGFVISAFWAAMMPWIIMSPFAVILTWKAMNDSRMINFEWITRLIHRMRTRKQRALPSQP